MGLASGLPALAEATLQRWFTSRFGAERPDVVEFAKGMLVGVEPAGYAACCSAIARFDFRQRLAQILQPTLVIFGTHDLAVNVDQAAVLIEQLPNSAGMQLDVAHIGNLGAPEQFCEAVRSFIQNA
jgi:3-oxoadipate enol-lactonase